MTPATLLRRIGRLYEEWLDDGVRQHEAFRRGAAREDEAELHKRAEDARAQAGRVFVLHMSVLVYGLLTIAGIRDKNLYSVQSAIKLPVVDVEVPPDQFFLLFPLMALLTFCYLHIHIGHLCRLLRQLRISRKEGGEPARWPDSPWLASFEEDQGLASLIARAGSSLLVKWATPLVLLSFWLRVLFTRATVHSWLEGVCLPPVDVIGAITAASILVSLGWTSARRALEVRLKLRPPSSRSARAARLVFAAAAPALLLSHWWWYPALRGQWLGPAMFRLTRAQLRSADLSLPPRAEGTHAAGPILYHVDLTGGSLEYAYLDNAMLSGARLRSARMTKAALREAELGGADLTYAELEGAGLSGSALEQASLDCAHLDGATFDGAFLGGAKLRLAHGRKVSLKRAQLQGAVLQGADLRGADLEEANLSNARLDPSQSPPCKPRPQTEPCASCTHLEEVRLVRAVLRDADLSDARLRGADLTAGSFRGGRLGDADLSDTRAAGADFSQAMLQNVTLTRGHFEGSDFGAARLAGARLDDAHVEAASFRDAHLEGVNASGMFAAGAVFDGARLEGVDLRGAHLEGASFRGARLGGAQFGGAFLEGADFRGANLSAVDLPPDGEMYSDVVSITLKRRAGLPPAFEGITAKSLCGRIPGVVTATEDPVLCDEAWRGALKSVSASSTALTELFGKVLDRAPPAGRP